MRDLFYSVECDTAIGQISALQWFDLTDRGFKGYKTENGNYSVLVPSRELYEFIRQTYKRTNGNQIVTGAR